MASPAVEIVAPVSAQDRPVGRLRVVEAPGFSSFPHAVIRDTRVSRDARLLYAVLQMYWWQDGECWASHGTLADDMGCTVRSLRVYLDELIAAGLVVERASGMRRAKVYAPAPIGTKQPIEQAFNTSKSSDWNVVNRKKTTVQSEENDSSNTSKSSDSYKKTPEKKTQEEDKRGAPRSAERATTLSGTLIDLVRAGGAEITMRGQDHKALKDSGADPALVAEAYCAIYHGRWGDEFCRRNLSVQFVIGRLAGYQATKANGPTRRPAPPGVTHPTLGSNGTRRQVKVRTFE